MIDKEKKHRCTALTKGEIRGWLPRCEQEYVAVYEYKVDNHYFAEASEPMKKKRESKQITIYFNIEEPREHYVLEFE